MKKFEKFLFLVIILFVAVSFTACEESTYSKYSDFKSSTPIPSTGSSNDPILNGSVSDSQFNDNLRRKKIIEQEMDKYSNMIYSGKSLSKSEMNEYTKLNNELNRIISVNALYKVQQLNKNPNWVDPETGKSEARIESDKRIQEEKNKKDYEFTEEEKAGLKKFAEEYEKRRKEIEQEPGY